MEVTPHLKSVLKNYQHSATKSLQGPGLSLVAVKTETPSPEIKEEEFVAAPFPVQQVPILTIPDTCSERTETILEGESISCFVVGGEKRLCLPQVLNSVLREFSLQQINQECDHLQIYCSRCTPEQLNVLKNQGILPSGAPSCGLITKTDAERLCSALLFKQVREQAASSTGLRPRKGALSIPIYHECFGRASGLCFPELYVNKNAKCIECGDCQVGFSPQQFVCHVHDELENRTVHWGFDSGNWRSYLYVPIDHGERERFVKILDEMKEMYDGNLVFPPPIVEPVIKRKQVPSVAEIIKDHELPLKKQKLSEYHNALAHIPYNVQHLQQIYASLDQVYIHQYLQECSPNRHLSAFKPVVQSIKESKIRHATAMGRYPADPPVLQHPERVVPSSESERFERTYQPNVALAPPPALPKKHRYGKEFAEVKTEPVEDEAKPVVSVVRKYNPEIELSTDTEDSASETEKCDINKLEELLRDVDKSKKDKVVEYLRSVCKENERLSKNARVTDERLKELEYRNVELLKELNALKLKHHHHHHNHRAVENGVGSPNGDDATGLNGSSNTHEDEKTSKECQKSVIAIVGEQKDVKLKTAPE